MQAPQTLVTGIYQTDIVVRSAIIKSLEELRKEPELIRDALASLPQDELTAGKYGDKLIDELIKWFTRQAVPVKLGLALTSLKSPSIAVILEGGDESDPTVGDVDYDVSEPDPWHKGKRRQLASVHQRQAVRVEVFAQGEPEYVLFLTTLVVFGLLRHKEDLLDARGFTRLTWSVGGASRMGEMQGGEIFYNQTVRFSGVVRHCWPTPLPASSTGDVIQDVDFGVQAARPNEDPQTPVEPPPSGHDPFDPKDWEDRDILSGWRS